ncbi:MAG TPA: aldehyde dehydrogenase family protein [Gemmatimonadales bacterium]|jgi:aldehyde dehydrogenase (NAD(P)+)
MGRRELDEAIEVLWEGATRFATLSLEERIGLLCAMRGGYARVAFRTVVASCRAKRIVLGTPLEGEEWSLGPWPILRQFRLLHASLSAMGRGQPPQLGEIGAVAGGRLSLETFPGSTLDSFLLPGVEAHVHLHAGLGLSAIEDRARYYRSLNHPERVTLVLGAGNAAAIPCMDVLTKLFNEGSVCLLKMHPLNSYLGPLYEEAFAIAIEQGFLRVVYGGADAGAYLSRHPGIGEIHVTGSAETYEEIVWGDSAGRARRKTTGRQMNDKPITSMLGCVTPVLVVPGPYLDQQLAYQASALAGAVAHNAGCNCTTPRLLVTPGDWAQRNAFLRHLEAALAAAPLRLAYYPGATDRWQFLAGRRAGVRFVGSTVGGMLPWTVVPDLEADDRNEPLFSLEPFCPVVSEVQVGSSDPVEFLDAAVDFVNDRVWGTLSVTLLVHPRTLADPEIAPAIERAIARLRYGTVGVNVWPQLSFALGSSPWGPHQSSTPADIQSGRGWVHNTPMLEHIEKVVIREELSFRRKQPYAAGHRAAHHLFRRLAWVERRAGWAGLPGVVEASFRG